MNDAFDHPVEAVLFDWDGTLIDSKQSLIATYQAATTEVFGRPYPTAEEDIHEIVQLRGRESFELIAQGDAEAVERLAEAFQRAYRVHQAETELFPETVETLRQLHAAGLRLGVATSKARVRVCAESDRTGLTELLDTIVSGDDIRRAKPDPESVAEAIRRLGADPARSLYVGDGPNDVRAARGAGAIPVGVSYGFHPAELRAEGPAHMVDAAPELLPVAGVATG